MSNQHYVQTKVPLRFIRFQLDTVKRIIQALLRSTKKSTEKTNDAELLAIEISKKIASPNPELVEAYIAWCQAPKEKYTTILPAHMVCQWSLKPVPIPSNKLIVQHSLDAQGLNKIRLVDHSCQDYRYLIGHYTSV